MAERERSHTRPRGGVFVPRAQVMSADDVRRATSRMAHEIAERNPGLEDLVLVGLQTGGVGIAHRLAETLQRVEGSEVPVGTLDVAFYRDDIGLRPVLPEAATDISVDLTGRTVVLVDDVLFTGRTIRAALNALGDYGRAQAVELAVMVDRGHRELPIRPDYVGKNLPTSRDEMVDVSEDGVSIGELVGR
ncbi:MAG TPA: bifunctional pyr operon transcriptional regulator/uracil phosphoribosyltransferase PyrR [Acidimicrobiales bacterium]|nr:bifunctional pyr operon transcriptional regulator/uracil phosphoribosyltransferase PyrR [Acidimicrobiales bacterium]